MLEKVHRVLTWRCSTVWNCVEAPNLFKAKQIDAGMGQVVATNYLQKTYALNKGDWTLLSDYPLQMKYITTGTDGIWGVSTKNQLYRMIAGNFTKVPGERL